MQVSFVNSSIQVALNPQLAQLEVVIGRMNKVAPTIILLCAILFALVSSLNLGSAQTGTQVSGVISTDTTWTKTGSPYELTGNVLVDSDATLTIDSDVTVHTRTYYIMVRGLLTATIVTLESDSFVDAAILFQDGSGGTISYSSITGRISIEDASPSISRCNITTVDVSGGSPIISNNIFKGRSWSDQFDRGHQTANGIYLDEAFNSPINATITDNTFSNFAGAGILMYGGSPVIQRNLFLNLPTGIYAVTAYKNDYPTISNNSFSYCKDAINGRGSLTIFYNNFENSSRYNVFYNGEDNLNSAYNWWGTANPQAINKTIYDFKDDFNLGRVEFTPFLDMPNPYALPDSNAPLPTALPTPQSTVAQTFAPTQTENTLIPPASSTATETDADHASNQHLLCIIIVVLSVLVAVLAVVVGILARKTSKIAT